MIVDKKYKVLITSRNIGRFKSKYDVIRNKVALINVNDLSIGSHLPIDVKCDLCGDIFKRPYKAFLKYREKFDYDTCSKCKYDKVKKTNMDKFGVENPFQSEEIKTKIKKTWVTNYGVDNPAKSDIIQERIKNTNLERYGHEYGLSNTEVRDRISETKADRGLQLHPSDITEYRKYRNKVDTLTKLVKEELLDNWDGYDFYDGEYIKKNFELNSNDGNYPTIDHKTSVYESFKNNINPEVVAEMCNLCITKRSINSKKHNHDFDEFIEKLNF